MVLPVVLYGCEPWSLTLIKVQRLRVLKRIFGPKRDEVPEGWSELHIGDLCNLFPSPSIIRMIMLRRMR
jgi:hypothetical protein